MSQGAPSAKHTLASLMFGSLQEGVENSGPAPHLSVRCQVLLCSPAPEDWSADTEFYRPLYSVDDDDSDKTRPGIWAFPSNLSCSLAHPCLSPIYLASPGIILSLVLLSAFMQIGS